MQLCTSSIYEEDIYAIQYTPTYLKLLSCFIFNVKSIFEKNCHFEKIKRLGKLKEEKMRSGCISTCSCGTY
jgi:hypothetical protein